MVRKSFEDSISDWVRKTENRMLAVFQLSCSYAVEEAQLPIGLGGRMRIDTGFLRASGTGSKVEMPKINVNAQPGTFTYAYQESEVELVLTTLKLGDTFYFGWTASYAAAREYGASGQEPDAFLRGAVGRWQEFVNRATQEAVAVVNS